MRKNSYFCDRCGCQIEDCGAKIVPHYFDFDTEDLTVPINKDMEIRHYCMDCTMEALEFLEAKNPTPKKKQEGKKNEDIPTAEKDEVNDLDKKWEELKSQKEGLFANYAAQNKVVRQLIDLALLQNGMLKGEALNNFVKRSIDLIK